MDWIKVDEEIFDHVGKRISEGDTPLQGCVIAPLREKLLRTYTQSAIFSRFEKSYY
jgi:hypothetical protein